MALSPLDRPAGSSQVLRYRGVVALPNALATFPKANATFPSDATIVGGTYFVAYARFALFDPGAASPPLDPVALANTRRRLPSFVYDDSQPAGNSPHALTTAAGVVGINNGEQLYQTTWMQNLEVHSARVDDNVLEADVGIAVPNGVALADGSFGVFGILDTATGGLGLNTGLPVIMVPFKVLVNDGELQSFYVDITFEIRHTPHR